MTTDQAFEPAIRVQGIEKSFKDLHVLRGVNFDVSAGSIFALLGSNGAGKTTLVRILSTLLKADAGTATVHGFDVAAQPGDVRESISLTGQFAAVDDVLTGRENWPVRLIDSRTSPGWAATSKPWTVAVTASTSFSTGSAPAWVLPAPFEPSNAKMLPALTSKLTPRSL